MARIRKKDEGGMKRGTQGVVKKVYMEVQNAWDNNMRILSAQGGTRSGKTYNIMIWMIMFAASNPDEKIGICRKSFPVVYDSVYKDFRDIMMQLGLWYEERMNQTHHEYTMKNGSVFVFFAADQSGKLKGKKNTITWLNEATEMNYMDFQQLVLRTSDMMVLDYNPDYEEDHWLMDVNKRDDCRFFVTTYRDNIFLGKSQIEEIERLQWTNPTLWEQYGNGQRCRIQGLVFPYVEKVDSWPANVKKKFVGVDYGYTNDPTVIVKVGLTKDAMYVEQICYRRGMKNPEIAERLEDERLRGLEIITESADPGKVDDIEGYMGGKKKMTRVNKGGKNSHKVLLSSIGEMQRRKIYVVGESPDVAREYQHYCYELDKSGNPTNQPVDAYNHGIDAARYVVIMRGMKKKVVSVKIQYNSR